jgi:hypothetical protein
MSEKNNVIKFKPKKTEHYSLTIDPAKTKRDSASISTVVLGVVALYVVFFLVSMIALVLV